MRRLAAAFAFACLALGPVLAAASDYENFNKAYDKYDYAKAAKLAIAMGPGGASATALERFGNACVYAGRIPEAVEFKVARLYREEYYGQVPSSAVLAEARSIAQLAAQGKVTPYDAIIAAMTSVEAGDTLAGVRTLHAQYERRGHGMERSLCGDALVAYVFPALESAMKRGDRTQAGELAKCRPVWTPDQYRRDVITALEWGGDVAGAVRQAYEDVFNGQSGKGPYTYAGNPTLLPFAAEIAHRNHYSSDIPLVAAYAMHLAGDTKGALAALERIATKPGAAANDDTVCVARFVAGALCRELGDLRKALSWYHLAAWSDFEYWEARYISPATYRDAQDPVKADYFHFILGAVRQADVLLAQGRPKVAIDELGTIIDMDRLIREHVNGNSTLVSEWSAASEAIEAKLAAESGSGQPAETIDSLGYYANDWILDPKGRLVPRPPARVMYERMLAEHEALRQWLANERTSPEFKAFLESQEQAQAAAEAAKSAAESPSPTARAQAFQLKQQMRSNVCVRCKGRGTLYVPPNERQGWKFSEVDKQVVDTRIYTSAYMVKCHWCDGTGKR